MELTVASKFMSKEILEKRRQIIENEKLHIEDTVSKEEFKNLYNKYGKGFDEKDFAWAFLDIDERKYYNLDKGKTERTTILSYEYVSNEEFENIRNQVTEAYGLKNGEKRSSKEILEMYSKFSNRLSIKLFLEEVLGIRGNIIKNFKKGDVNNGTINFNIPPGEYNTFHKKKPEIPMYALNPVYIYELRKKMLVEVGLRVRDTISYDQIQTLNKEFCPDLPEIVFAEKVIGMSANEYNGLKATKSKNPQNEFVFQDVNIPNEYLKELASKIAILHKLEAGQLLKREEFYDYYNKYGGILSKKSFAILVLEMTDKGYSDTIENEVAKSTTVLSSMKKTDLRALSKKIVISSGFHHGDMLKYEAFKSIHQLYAPNVSEFVFAEEVFGIKSYSLENMKYNGGRSRIKVELPTNKQLKELQKKVILENNIHINDRMNYDTVEKLHKVYGGILPINMFAIEILGITKQSFIIIKNHKEKNAFALFNLKIAHSEICKIKRNIMKTADLQEPRELTYKEIEDLYNMYGGIMSQKMFLRQIMGINVDIFNDLKDGQQEKTMACVRLDFNENEIKELKKYLSEGLTYAKIAIKMGVTTTFLRINMNQLIEEKQLTQNNILYEKVKTLIEQGNSPEEIQENLEIDEEDLREIITVCEETQKKEEKRQKIENKEKEIKTNALKALYDYEYTPKNINKVRQYIKECVKNFKLGKFVKKDLDLLMECMVFVQCNCEEIELFSRICVYFKEYKMANNFIIENIDNEDIKPEEKIKLRDLRDNIIYTIKKEKAKELLKTSKRTPQEIAIETGVLETDVLRIKKKLDEERMPML